MYLSKDYKDYSDNRYLNVYDEKNKEGKIIPQRSEHVFQDDNDNTGNYINVYDEKITNVYKYIIIIFC